MRARQFSGRQVIVDGSARRVDARGEQGELGVVHFELGAQAPLKPKGRDAVRLVGFGGVLLLRVIRRGGAGKLRLRTRYFDRHELARHFELSASHTLLRTGQVDAPLGAQSIEERPGHLHAKGAIGIPAVVLADPPFG